MKTSILIRGIGVVSPLGVGVETVNAALIDGTLATLTPGKSDRMAARVTGDLEACLETPKTYLDRASLLTLAAANLARQNAGWNNPGDGGGLPGISLGTAAGCSETMVRFWQTVLQKGPRLANSLFFAHSYPNTPASLEAIEHGLTGAHLTFCQGMASGALAVIGAMDALALGQSDRMIAGGFEAIPPGNSPTTGTRLFGEDAALPPGEGAVFLALERDNGSPGAVGRLAGSGTSGFLPLEPGKDWSIRDHEAVRQGILAAMRKAIGERSAGDVGLVVLSASGNPHLDRAELEAVAELFPSNGEEAPICTAVNGRFGLAPGASSLYGLLAALIALREEWIVEVGCPVGEDAALLPNLAVESVERPIRLALVNSIDAGGACVTLAVER